jgi:hypothetical protein
LSGSDSGDGSSSSERDAKRSSVLDLGRVRKHVRLVSQGQHGGGGGNAPGVPLGAGGSPGIVSAVAAAARKPRSAAKTSRKNNGGWRVGHGNSNKSVGGRKNATAILTSFIDGIDDAVAVAGAEALGRSDHEAALVSIAAKKAAAGPQRECVHVRYLNERPRKTTMPDERCEFTVFSAENGGEYVCNRTGLVTGGGLILLAEREHLGDVAAHGDDGDGDDGDGDGGGDDYGDDPISRGGEAAEDAGGDRAASAATSKQITKNVARGEREISGAVMRAVRDSKAGAERPSKEQAANDKTVAVVTNLVTLLLCQSPILIAFYARRNTNYFTAAGKAATAFVRTTMDPPRGSRTKARCPFPHEVADIYAAKLNQCCVMPSSVHRAATAECVTRILMSAYTAIASTPAGPDILDRTPTSFFVGLLCAMQGEGKIYTTESLRNEDMPHLAMAIHAQGARAQARGLSVAGPFDDPLGMLVCVPTGRFISDLPAPADLSSISKLQSQRRGGRVRGHMACPETSHVTSGACRLKECFLSMLRMANLMEVTDPGTGLAYVYAKIHDYRVLMRNAAPIYVTF